MAILLAGTLVGASAAENIGYACYGVSRVTISDDWRSALEWMGANTPDPGVDYYAAYEKDGFSYPKESYGIMSWWDYGHWITFVAQRIPNTKPLPGPRQQRNRVPPGHIRGAGRESHNGGRLPLHHHRRQDGGRDVPVDRLLARPVAGTDPT